MQSPQALCGEVLLNRTMMEANTAVGGGIEKSPPEQRLPFRGSPIGKDRRGIENAVRSAMVECLVGRPDGACTGQCERECETLRPEPGLGVGENTTVGPLRVVLQLGGNVRLMLLCPSAETPRARPDLDQIGQVEGPTGEYRCILPRDFREKRSRVVHTARFREDLDLPFVHRKHDDRPHRFLIRTLVFFGVHVRPVTVLIPEGVDEHFLGWSNG